MNLPKLAIGQYALIHAEVMTGIITFADGQRYLGEGDAWMIFNGLEDATMFALQKVIECPAVECSIFDHSNVLIRRHWNEEKWKSFSQSGEGASSDRAASPEN